MLKINRPDNSPKNSILIYTTEDGLTKIDTTFDGDTVWLSIDQMADLFQRDRSVIGKHIRNIFKEGELQKESVWAKFAYTAADGKTYDVDYYYAFFLQKRYRKTKMSPDGLLQLSGDRSCTPVSFILFPAFPSIIIEPVSF